MDLYKYKQAKQIILTETDVINKEFVIDKVNHRIYEVSCQAKLYWDITEFCKAYYEENIDNLATILYGLCISKINKATNEWLQLFEIEYL